MIRAGELVGRAVVAYGNGNGNGDDSNGGSSGPSPIQTLGPFIVAIGVIINFIIFIPIYLITSYSFLDVFPVLAMVEDEKPPAYDPVSLNDPETSSLPEEDPLAPRNKNQRPINGATDSKPITSSFRELNRLVRSNGGINTQPGWRASFRSYIKGFSVYFLCNLVAGLLVSMSVSALHPFFAPLATLIASLGIVQLSTTWVHIIITPITGHSFWRRMPSFKRSFNATWKPVVLHWVATEVSVWAAQLTAFALGINVFGIYSGEPIDMGGAAWKAPIVFLVGLLGTIFLAIPTQVILVRVQASLLPMGTETIVPFDRTFSGKVEPTVVGGDGFATISDVWSSFTGSAWRRLLMLYVKAAAAFTLINFAFGAVVGIEWGILALIGSAFA